MARFLRVTTILLALFVQVGEINAQSAAEFYNGKMIRWVVPYRPGGGYDQYSRLLAPFIEKYSNSAVEIVNIPGAGGMKGAVEVYRSPPDGLHLGLVNGSALVGNEIAGMEGIAYQVAEFNFVARISAEDRVLVVGADSGLATIEDALGANVILGTTGAGGSSYVDTMITRHVLDAQWKVIPGFDSSADLRLAILRGDIHGMWGSYGSSIEGIVAGDLVPILRAGILEVDALVDVPSVTELVDGNDELIDAWQGLAEVGRPVVAPPGVPEDRLTFLREVLRSATADPEFLEQARMADRQINYMSGEEIEAVTRRAGQMGQSTRDLLAAALKGEL